VQTLSTSSRQLLETQVIDNRKFPEGAEIRLGHSGSVSLLWPVFRYLQIDHLSKRQVTVSERPTNIALADPLVETLATILTTDWECGREDRRRVAILRTAIIRYLNVYAIP
jgi:hypothetical protein